MGDENVYAPLQRTEVFICKPKSCHSCIELLENRIVDELAGHDLFIGPSSLQLTTDEDFVVGSNRQQSFCELHGRASVAIYPICKDFISEFADALGSVSGKVIFVLCEPGTDIPEQWKQQQMLDMLNDRIDHLAKLIEGIKVLVRKNTKSTANHPRQIKQKKTVFVNVKRNDYTLCKDYQHKIQHDFIESFSSSEVPDLRTCLKRLRVVDTSEQKMRAREYVLQHHIPLAVSENNASALALCFECHHEKVITTALDQLLEMYMAGSLDDKELNRTLSFSLTHLMDAFCRKDCCLIQSEYQPKAIVLAIFILARSCHAIGCNGQSGRMILELFRDLIRESKTSTFLLEQRIKGELKTHGNRILLGWTPLKELCGLYLQLLQSVRSFVESNKPFDSLTQKTILEVPPKRFVRDSPSLMIVLCVILSRVLHGDSERTSYLDRLTEIIKSLEKLKYRETVAAMTVIAYILRLLLLKCEGVEVVGAAVKGAEVYVTTRSAFSSPGAEVSFPNGVEMIHRLGILIHHFPLCSLVRLPTRSTVSKLTLCFVDWSTESRTSLLEGLQIFMTIIRNKRMDEAIVTECIYDCVFMPHLKNIKQYILMALFQNERGIRSHEAILYQNCLKQIYSHFPITHVQIIEQPTTGIANVTAVLGREMIFGKIALGVLEHTKSRKIVAMDLLSKGIRNIEELAGHPNVVDMIAFQRSPVPVYYLMAHSDAGHLFKYLCDHRKKFNRLSIAQQVQLALDAANVMKACLEKSIYLHCLLLEGFDIFIGKDNRMVLKLRDFEFSSKADKNAEITYLDESLEGKIPVRYQAPETLLGSIINEKTQVYLLACFIYSLFLYAAPPFVEHGAIPIQEIARLIVGGYRLKQTPNIPEEIFQILQNATHCIADNRYQLDDLINELEAYLKVCPDKVDLHETAPELPDLGKHEKIAYHLSENEVKFDRSDLQSYESEYPEKIQEAMNRETIYHSTQIRGLRETYYYMSVSAVPSEDPFSEVIDLDPDEDHDLEQLFLIWNKKGSRYVAPWQRDLTNQSQKLLKYDCNDSVPLLEAARRLSDEACVKIFQQIVDGVQHDFHEHGYIHNHLKAEHIRISRENRVLLTHFGRARKLPERHYDTFPEHFNLTVDTLDDNYKPWCGLETLQHNIRRMQSESYALAVIFWEVLQVRSIGCVVQPFPFLSLDELKLKLSRGLTLPMPANCPLWLYDLMKRCWNQDVSCRPTLAQINNVLANTTHDQRQTLVGLMENGYSLCRTDVEQPHESPLNARKRMSRRIAADTLVRREKDDLEKGYFNYGVDQTAAKKARRAPENAPISEEANQESYYNVPHPAYQNHRVVCPIQTSGGNGQDQINSIESNELDALGAIYISTSQSPNPTQSSQYAEYNESTDSAAYVTASERSWELSDPTIVYENVPQKVRRKSGMKLKQTLQRRGAVEHDNMSLVYDMPREHISSEMEDPVYRDPETQAQGAVPKQKKRLRFKGLFKRNKKHGGETQFKLPPMYADNASTEGFSLERNVYDQFQCQASDDDDVYADIYDRSYTRNITSEETESDSDNSPYIQL